MLLKDFWLHFEEASSEIKVKIAALSTKTEPAARAEMSFTAVIPSWWLWCFIQKFLGISLCFSGSRTAVRSREVKCSCLKTSSITHCDSMGFLGTPHWHNILLCAGIWARNLFIQGFPFWIVTWNSCKDWMLIHWIPKKKKKKHKISLITNQAG